MENVWEIAKNMELEGEEYYRNLVQQTDISEIKGVFSFLADQEREHFNFFDALQSGSEASVEEIKDSITITKDAFKKIASGLNTKTLFDNAEEAYKKAVGLEEKAVEFYTSLLSKVENDTQKKALQLIIKEENKHRAIMETMVDFLAGGQTWLENAEFNHLKEY